MTPRRSSLLSAPSRAPPPFSRTSCAACASTTRVSLPVRQIRAFRKKTCASTPRVLLSSSYRLMSKICSQPCMHACTHTQQRAGSHLGVYELLVVRDGYAEQWCCAGVHHSGGGFLVHTCACIRAYVRTCVNAGRCVCVYTCTHMYHIIYKYKYIYIYIYIYYIRSWCWISRWTLRVAMFLL